MLFIFNKLNYIELTLLRFMVLLLRPEHLAEYGSDE